MLDEVSRKLALLGAYEQEQLAAHFLRVVDFALQLKGLWDEYGAG